MTLFANIELRSEPMTSLPELIVLRDIPSIAEIEDFSHGRGAWRTEAEIAQQAETASVGIFGIAINDTWHANSSAAVSEDQFARQERRPEAWEIAFAILYDESLDDEEYAEFWRENGIDITDGQGDILRCFDYFARQIVCLIQPGLHPYLPPVAFTPDGSGGQAQRAEAWGAALEEDARSFWARRGR